MSFIKVISPEDATGHLDKIYKQVKSPQGQVDNVLQVHSLRPHTLVGHMGIYKAVLHHSGNVLPEWFLEAVGVVVSIANGCDYCARHHTAGLERLLKASSLDRASYVSALGQATPGEPFTVREQRGLAYARKLTREPGNMVAADIELLRASGFDDGEILELNQVAAYFAYANRTVSGLGVDIEGEMLGQSPSTDSEDSNWSHS